MPPAKRAFIINGDEHQHVMSTVLERAGPRSRTYVDPDLGAAQRKVYANPHHNTGMYWTMADGEVGPPHELFDSGATTEERISHEAR